MSAYDVLLFPNLENNKYAFIEDNEGIIQGARGAFILASRVSRVLLTTPGSIPMRPEEGSALALLPGSVYDKRALRTLVVREVSKVERYIKRQQLASGLDVPLSEALASITVIKVDFIGDDKVNIRLLVTSRSGENVNSEVVV
jgi:phage baseplate assembly protein W